MSVRWQELTGSDLKELSKRTEVAILPIGCVEWHGPHLPTGIDAFAADAIAVRAAEIEPAVVLPPIYYNINDEMKCYPATISIPPRTVVDLYHAICEECARNGFNRIILLIGHGGSETTADMVEAELLERRTRGEGIGYAVFWISCSQLGVARREELIHTPIGHACEYETSLAMAIVPSFVRIERIEEDGPVKDRAVDATYRVDWIRRVPKGYIGRPQNATAEKGRQIIDASVGDLVKVIRQVKGFDPNADA